MMDLSATETQRPKFPPSRIVCLTEETVETLYLLGEQDRIVGISEYVVPGSDMEGSISGNRPIAKGDASRVRNGLFAGGRRIRTLGPPVADLLHSRLCF